jgi:cytochrome c553
MKRPLAIVAGLALAAAHAIAAEPAAKTDPAAGQKIASGVCAACHGPDGNSPTPANPSLAGQIPEYVYKQLVNFKAAEGKGPERKNAIMQGMVANLSVADKRNLAAYFALQTPKPNAARNKDTVELGQRIYRAGLAERNVPACAACHGASGGGVPAQYPRLAGQYTEYTAAQMKAWRSGERANDQNRMMRSIAARLTDEEIAAVSDYIAGLH